MEHLDPSSRSYVLFFLSLQRLSRRVLMEDYLLRNKGEFLVPVFKAAIWDNTFEKDPGDCPEASSLNEPGFGIVSIKPLPTKPSEPWPDQDRVKVKKALRESSSQSRVLQKQPEGRAEILRFEHTTLQIAY
ncbi:hypothetical protein SESBI_25301 [Sesbania bispinosa]|nr:hypothetical protein SESBI_25301 [Sesbania bispinosa]